MEDKEDEIKDPYENPFTEEELHEIRLVSETSPAIKKLADRYALMFSEPDKEFYAALAYASKRVSTLVFNERLNVDNPKHKALLHILKEGAAYYKSLQVGKEKAGNPEKEEEIQGAVKPEAKRSGGSIAEKYAKKTGDK